MFVCRVFECFSLSLKTAYEIGFRLVFFFFFKQKTAYEIMPSLVGSEMCIRDSVMRRPFAQLPLQAYACAASFSAITQRVVPKILRLRCPAM